MKIKIDKSIVEELVESLHDLRGFAHEAVMGSTATWDNYTKAVSKSDFLLPYLEKMLDKDDANEDQSHQP